MKKQFLNESDRKQILADKEKAILENFAKTFNSIKRIDESELKEYDLEAIKKQLADTGYPADDEELSNIQGAIDMGKNKPTDNNKLKEYDNYNYPAGADADPNAPWHQDDYETQYEYRNGELEDVDFVDKNYNGPIENEKLEFRSTDGGICRVTMGQIFKELNVPQNTIEEFKAYNTTHQDFLEAREIHKETGEWPEQYTQKVDKYNDIFELLTNKYGNEYAEYEHEIEPEERERDDYDRDDYDNTDYDREYGGVYENELKENNESTVLTSTDKNDLKQDIAKLKKEKPDAKVGEITKNGKIFTVRITF